MSKRDFNRLRHAGKATEPTRAPKPVTGCNTHIKRQPVKTYTDEEKARWLGFAQVPYHERDKSGLTPPGR